MTRLAPLLVLSVALSVSAAEYRGSARLWAGPGYDTNARRDFVSPGTPTDPDAFFFALGQLQGLVDFGKTRVVGSYDIGARKFVLLPSEDTLVQMAQVEATYQASPIFGFGLGGHVRDRRGADRDYTDLLGEAVITFTPDEASSVQVRGGAHRFLFWPRFAYSHSGPDLTVLARYRFNRRHSAALSGNLNLRTYNSQTNPNPNDDTQSTTVRRDTVSLVGLTYSYRGPFHVTVGYSYLDQASNSYGETLRRHRFTLTAGFRLPWELTVLATGALQFTQYPDGVFLSPELQVIEDDENSSSVTAKIVKPIGQRFEVDVRYALYVNVLPQNAFFYFRQVISAGVAFNF